MGWPSVRGVVALHALYQDGRMTLPVLPTHKPRLYSCDTLQPLTRPCLCCRFRFSTTSWEDVPSALPLSYQFVTLTNSTLASASTSVSSSFMDPSTSTIISGIVLPMSEAGPGGVVRIGVIVKNSLGCEVVMDVASAAIVTLSPPSLDSLAARFLPATPDGGSASGSDTYSTSPGPDSTAVGHRTVPVSR